MYNNYYNDLEGSNGQSSNNNNNNNEVTYRTARNFLALKNYIIIQGDLCLEKPFELAAKTNFRQKQLFVYKTLFTLLGHMTNFVYKSHDKNYTRRFMPWKGLQGDFSLNFQQQQ